MKKSENGLIDFSSEDSITPVIESGKRRAAGRRMTAAQRRRADREAERVRITIDVPGEEYKKYLEDWAASLGVSLSSLVLYLVAAGSDHVTDEQIERDRYPIRSMRYEYRLQYEQTGDQSKRRGR